LYRRGSEGLLLVAIDNEATFFAAGARRPELVNDGRTELKSIESKAAMRAQASKQQAKLPARETSKTVYHAQARMLQSRELLPGVPPRTVQYVGTLRTSPVTFT